MPLDPKYANLPWIAHEQPDVFESSDLPEADQHLAGEPEELNSESVEKIDIKAQDAIKNFDGKKLKTGDVDFSDGISKSKKSGYTVDTNEYEIVGPDERSKETPVQKFQRLQSEIRQLVEEVQQVTEQVKSENETVTPAQLAAMAESLQTQLADNQLSRMVGEEGKLDLNDPSGNIHKRLLQQIESCQSSKKGGKKSEDGSGDKVVYQLCYQPDASKNLDQNKLSSLDQRIQRVEALLGSTPNKVASLTADTANKSLLEAVTRISARSSLLDSSHLDQIETRMNGLNLRLQSITEKKEVIADADSQTKIAELYEMVKKWDSVSDALPTLVTRLTALEELHTQALQFSQALTHLDTNQQQVSNAVKSHKDLVAKLHESLKETMDTVKENCETMETRLKKLGK